MIRIQKLKQPKKTSGIELPPGQSQIIKKIKIQNTGKETVWVDTYTRKPVEPIKGGLK